MFRYGKGSLRRSLITLLTLLIMMIEARVIAVTFGPWFTRTYGTFDGAPSIIFAIIMTALIVGIAAGLALGIDRIISRLFDSPAKD